MKPRQIHYEYTFIGDEFLNGRIFPMLCSIMGPRVGARPPLTTTVVAATTCKRCLKKLAAMSHVLDISTKD